MYNIVGFILVLSAASVFGDFPEKIKRCKDTDNECLKKTIQDVIKNYYNGVSEIGLVTFDPLRIKTLLLPKNPSSPVNLELKFTDFDLYGLKTADLKVVKGFSFADRGLVEFVVPQLRLKGNYVMEGNVLILPIRGDGPFEIIGKNVLCRYNFNFKPQTKNGEIFTQIERVKLELKPENFHFQFDNLFNGDKALGDNMNKFLNENWSEIYGELDGGITKALGLVIKKVISDVLSTYPHDVLFEK